MDDVWGSGSDLDIITADENVTYTYVFLTINKSIKNIFLLGSKDVHDISDKWNDYADKNVSGFNVDNVGVMDYSYITHHSVNYNIEDFHSI